MNTLNNTPQKFNEAALAEAKKVNPDIPDDALPIVFINAAEVTPDPDEVNLELGGDPDDLDDWGGMSVREVLGEIQRRSSVMWLPKDYQGIGFAVHDGEKFGPTKWFVALKASELPKPYDENKAPANA